MTEREFRLAYSEIMEHYQFIEEHLERTYASLTDSTKYYYEGFQDVEKTNLRRLVKEIQKQEKARGVKALSDDLVKEIEDICEKRNFWAHECFTKLIFRPNGDVKYEEDVVMMRNDIAKARELRDTLFELQKKLFDEFKKNNEPPLPDIWPFQVVKVTRY